MSKKNLQKNIFELPFTLLKSNYTIFCTANMLIFHYWNKLDKIILINLQINLQNKSFNIYITNY